MGVLQMRRKRSYTEEFRRLAVARMQGCHNISALAKELEVPRRLLKLVKPQPVGPGGVK
jgi:transposase-like protein